METEIGIVEVQFHVRLSKQQTPIASGIFLVFSIQHASIGQPFFVGLPLLASSAN